MRSLPITTSVREQGRSQSGYTLATGAQINIQPPYAYKMFLYKSKGIPVIGRGGPQGCETLRFPHFLDNRLIDGGKAVSLTRRPLFTPQENS
jgi:hypothetical protein